jgi:MFS family permease
VAIAFAVLDLGGSATDLGIVFAAHSLLITVLVLAGGVFADRISPRLAMLRADVVRMLAAGTMAALLIAGVAEIWQLALLYAIKGAATAFFNPASDAILPQVVAAKRVQEANALLNLSHSVGRTAGPALAGVLLALGTPGWALAVDAGTFALSAAFLYRLRVAPKAPAAEPAFLSELRHGWREFSSRTWLWTIVLSAAISNAVFFAAFQVLGPVVANDSLGGSGAWAVIAAAFGAGSIVGGLVALRIRPRRPLLVGEAAICTIALPVVLLAGPSATVLIALGALVCGAGISLGTILYETTVVQNVPQEALSRVYAYDWFGSLALEPLGLILVGPLAAGLGISPTLWAAAAVLTLCQLAVLCVPSIRRMRARPGTPAATPRMRPLEPGD